MKSFSIRLYLSLFCCVLFPCVLVCAVPPTTVGEQTLLAIPANSGSFFTVSSLEDESGDGLADDNDDALVSTSHFGGTRSNPDTCAQKDARSADEGSPLPAALSDNFSDLLMAIVAGIAICLVVSLCVWVGFRRSSESKDAETSTKEKE